MSASMEATPSIPEEPETGVPDVDDGAAGADSFEEVDMAPTQDAAEGAEEGEEVEDTLVCGFMPDDSDYMSTAVLVKKELLGKGEYGNVYKGALVSVDARIAWIGARICWSIGACASADLLTLRLHTLAARIHTGVARCDGQDTYVAIKEVTARHGDEDFGAIEREGVRVPASSQNLHLKSVSSCVCAVWSRYAFILSILLCCIKLACKPTKSPRPLQIADPKIWLVVPLHRSS